MTESLTELYRLLFERFGPQNWWPAGTAFEMAVGAILTQNTAWKNVEKAISNLKREGLLAAGALHRASLDTISGLIRPAGYYNLKAGRLKSFLDHLFNHHEGSLEDMLNREPEELREELLSIWGVGPETADSILLYAAKHPLFVVDAYTKRVLFRHGLIERENLPYEEVRALFMENLPRDEKLFGEFHALMVRVAKEFCKKKPLCRGCPLEGWEGGPKNA